MAKSILTFDVKVTDLEIMKELIYMCREYYLELPEDMQIAFDDWEDRLQLESK
jgi:hypothetical protein